MKHPEPPPSLADLAEHAKVVGPLLTSPQHDLFRKANDAYLPWEKFRRQPMPHGVSPEAAWLVLAYIRMGSSRPVPLWTGAGELLRFWLDDKLLEDVLEIEAMGRDPLRLVESQSRGGARQEYVLNALMEEGIYSSLLEGAATTRRDAKRMLREGRDPRNRSERMVFNNYGVMRQLDGWAKEPLTVDRICEIHRMITEGTLDDPTDAGRIQAPGEERVEVVDDRDGRVLHMPPPASELPARLERLCAFANDEASYPPAVIRAAILHFQLAYDHPFVDGNGRSARALFYWFMLRHGYEIFRFLTISRAFVEAPGQYARAYLHTEQTGDLNYFLRFHLERIRRALEGLVAYLAKKRRQVEDAARRLRDWPELNLRQRLILEDALVEPGRFYTATFVMRTYGVQRPTALKDLRGLAEAGLLIQRRSGKELVFVAAEDITRRVRPR